MDKVKEYKQAAYEFYLDFKKTNLGLVVVNIMKYYSFALPICFLIAANDELRAPYYWGKKARQYLGHQSPEEFLFFSAHKSQGREMTREEAQSFWTDLEIPQYYDGEWPSQKEFLVDHITHFQPGVFRQMVSEWPAIMNWSNGQDFVEKYGQEVVQTYKYLRNGESQGRFAPWFKDIKRSWMYLEDLMPRMPSASPDQNLCMGVYEHPMISSFNDEIWHPEVVDQILDYQNTTFTIIPKGHRDMLHYQQNRDQLYCLAAGRQNFTFINPFQRDMLYPGGNIYREGQRPRSIPINYSPVDQDFSNANGRYNIYNHLRYKETIALERGDCVYIPAYYWYGSNNFAGMAIGFTFWYDLSSEWSRMLFQGLETKSM